MVRPSLVAALAFVFSILTIVGALSMPSFASGYAHKPFEVAAAHSQVSDCSERGARGPASCGICIDLCGAAFAAILPTTASAAVPTRGVADALAGTRFTDWRAAPDNSPPRA